MEIHISEHNTPKEFKCDICEKSFYLEWRLRKHLENHKDTLKVFCHYFNNEKVCPFEEIGCKFIHKDSKPCKNGGKCEKKLCQFRHNTKEVNKTNKKDDVDKIEKILDFALQNKDAIISCDKCDYKTSHKIL